MVACECALCGGDMRATAQLHVSACELLLPCLQKQCITSACQSHCCVIVGTQWMHTANVPVTCRMPYYPSTSGHRVCVEQWSTFVLPVPHVAVCLVQVHDLVQVRPGSAIPADGVMVAGNTSGGARGQGGGGGGVRRALQMSMRYTGSSWHAS